MEPGEKSISDREWASSLFPSLSRDSDPCMASILAALFVPELLVPLY